MQFPAKPYQNSWPLYFSGIDPVNVPGIVPDIDPVNIPVTAPGIVPAIVPNIAPSNAPVTAPEKMQTRTLR